MRRAQSEATSGPQRTVLITGATDGIGLELARLYQAEGARLLLVGRRPLDALDDPLLTPESYLHCDLARTDAAACVDAYLLMRGVGSLDLVVHNAAVGRYGPPARQSAADLDTLLAVNLYAPITLTHALLPHLQRAGGKLVFIASVAADLPVAEYATYGASKAALASFARNLRAERPGVQIQVIYPGATRTAMHAKSGVPAASRSRLRLADPRSVARRIQRAAGRRGDVTIGLTNRLLRAVGRTFPLERLLRRGAR